MLSDRLDQHGGVRSICGLWSVVCGLWSVICDLWSVVKNTPEPTRKKDHAGLPQPPASSRSVLRFGGHDGRRTACLRHGQDPVLPSALNVSACSGLIWVTVEEADVDGPRRGPPECPVGGARRGDGLRLTSTLGT